MKALQIELPPAEVSEERRGFFWLSNSMNLVASVSGNLLSWLVTQSVLFIELLGKYGALSLLTYQRNCERRSIGDRGK
jgi:hypothetical protein